MGNMVLKYSMKFGILNLELFYFTKLSNKTIILKYSFLDKIVTNSKYHLNYYYYMSKIFQIFLFRIIQIPL